MNCGVVERVELEGVLEALDVEWVRLQAGQASAGDGVNAGGGEQGVQSGVGTDVEEMVIRLQVAAQKVEHVPIKPF